MTFTPGDLWLLWLLSWIAAAAWSTSPVARQSSRERLTHIALISTGVILLFGHTAAGSWLAAAIVPIPPLVDWIAVGMVALGLGWSWWARIHLGRLWSANVTLKADHVVIRSGPYAITRHPIYTGLLLSAIATVVVRDVASAVFGFALIVIGVLVKIRQEERLLTVNLGSAYTTYRAEVPALVPRPWAPRNS